MIHDSFILNGNSSLTAPTVSTGTFCKCRSANGQITCSSPTPRRFGSVCTTRTPPRRPPLCTASPMTRTPTPCPSSCSTTKAVSFANLKDAVLATTRSYGQSSVRPLISKSNIHTASFRSNLSHSLLTTTNRYDSDSNLNRPIQRFPKLNPLPRGNSVSCTYSFCVHIKYHWNCSKFCNSDVLTVYILSVFVSPLRIYIPSLSLRFCVIFWYLSHRQQFDETTTNIVAFYNFNVTPSEFPSF